MSTRFPLSGISPRVVALAATFALTIPIIPSPASAHDSAALRAPSGSARGEARLSDDEVRVRGDDLAPGEIAVLIADASGGLLLVARETIDGDFDVRWRGTLPAGATSTAELRGRAVAVVAADGTTLLEGAFPRAAVSDELGAGTAALIPADGAAATLSGRIRVRARDGRHAIEVRVRGSEPGTVLAVCIVAADGAEESLGELTISSDGDGALEVDTGDGGALPFGAGGVAELAGLAVRVKDAGGNVILSGVVPALGADPHDAFEIEVELDLRAPAGSPEPGMRGDVQFESEPERDDIRVRLDEATPGREYTATIRRPDGEDSRETLAVLHTDEDGKAEVEMRGVTLPLGASAIADLEGSLVEVFDADGALVLSGVTPAAPTAPPPGGAPRLPRLEFEVTLAQPETPVRPAAHGKVELEEEDDSHEIEVEVEDLVGGAAYRVELRNLDGVAEALFDGVADSSGDIRQRTLILGREPLPFAVASFREYDGFTIAVLDADGALVLAGTVNVPQSGDGAGAGVAADPGLVSFGVVGKYDAVFLRGDTNRDFVVDLSDAVATLGFLFRGASPPKCKDGMDANDDGAIDISDPIFTLLGLFAGGEPMPHPGISVRGFDRKADELFCKDE